MPGLAIIERFLQTLTLVDSQEVTLDLPRDFVYAGLLLRPSGTLTVAGGAANGVLDDFNPWSYINRVMLEGTGGGQATMVKNIKGYHAARVQHLLQGVEPERTPIVGAGVQAATAWSCEIPVSFAMPGAQVPPELSRVSLLNPAQFSKLTLTLRAGSPTDFIRGGDRTVTVPLKQVDVIAQQAVNVKVLPSQPLKYRETSFLADAFTAAITDRRFSASLPTGARYRYLLVNTVNLAANANQPVDDAITALKIFVGTTQIRRFSTPLQIANRNRQQNTVGDARAHAGLNAFAASNNPIIGFYMLDFMVGGRGEGILDTRNLPGLGVPLDVFHDTAALARTVEVVTGELLG